MNTYHIFLLVVIIFFIGTLAMSIQENKWQQLVLKKQQTYQLYPVLKANKSHYKEGAMVLGILCCCMFTIPLFNQFTKSEAVDNGVMMAQSRGVDVASIEQDYISELWQEYISMEMAKQTAMENLYKPLFLDKNYQVIEKAENFDADPIETSKVLGRDGNEHSLFIYHYQEQFFLRVPSINENYYLLGYLIEK